MGWIKGAAPSPSGPLLMLSVRVPIRSDLPPWLPFVCTACWDKTTLQNVLPVVVKGDVLHAVRALCTNLATGGRR